MEALYKQTTAMQSIDGEKMSNCNPVMIFSGLK